MQKDFPKLFFICSVICFIFSSSFAVINVFFPQYLNNTQMINTPVNMQDHTLLSPFSSESNGTLPDTNPLMSWLQLIQSGSFSSLDQFQILGVSFVMGSPKLSRVILSQPGQPARTYAQGKEISEGVVVDQITAQGVQLRSADNQTKLLLLPDPKNKDTAGLINSPLNSPIGQAMMGSPNNMLEPYSAFEDPTQTPPTIPPEVLQKIQPQNQ